MPSGFSEKDELIWTLTTQGKTEKAYATLRPDYSIDDVVKASETGALGAGTSSPEVRANKPPIGRGRRSARRCTAKVGEPVTLVARVTDDGIPKPRDAGARSPPRGRARPAPTPARSATPSRNRAMHAAARVTVGKNVGLHLVVVRLSRRGHA